MRRADPAQPDAGLVFGPTIAGVLIVAAVAAAFGFLILRRRGVYFSLLTLALAAMLYAVSFRWTKSPAARTASAVSPGRRCSLSTWNPPPSITGSSRQSRLRS